MSQAVDHFAKQFEVSLHHFWEERSNKQNTLLSSVEPAHRDISEFLEKAARAAETITGNKVDLTISKPKFDSKIQEVTISYSFSVGDKTKELKVIYKRGALLFAGEQDSIKHFPDTYGKMIEVLENFFRTI